jgi:hypothetical protein
VALSFDVPDILRRVPAGTCWPLIGTVILTPCNTEDEEREDDDDGNCEVDCFDVLFASDVVDDDGDGSGWSSSCDAFFDDDAFVLDVFDDDGIIGNCGNAD